MKTAELVFVPSPGVGHLVSTVEIAKCLVERDARLSITVFIVNSQFQVKGNTPYPTSLASSISNRIRFVDLPPVVADSTTDPLTFLTTIIEKQKPFVRKALADALQSNRGSDHPQLAGFVVDMFCTPMIDVANEFEVPTYIYYTSSAGFLSVTFQLHRGNSKDTAGIDDMLVVPGFANPIPAKVLPWVLRENAQTIQTFYGHVQRFAEAKGIIVNTFMELESSVLKLLPNHMPPVYPVGPILNIGKQEAKDAQKYDEIMKWLDSQRQSSVVFLCFGSMGSFPEEQVKEIAAALEKSGYPFLWSLRQAPPKGKIAMPSDYGNFAGVLPGGFLDRTVKIGRVIGWAPQVAILSHPAIGGFVSHCGWNSTLESIWFDVPIATWPLYAEQQFNAFCLVKEFGLAAEIKMDYRKNLFAESQEIVMADVIERGIKGVMELHAEKREKVKEMSGKSQKALEKGGSSYAYLGQFIDDVLRNIS